MWLCPQTSARSQRREPSIRLESLGIKSSVVSCTSAIAMATALESSAASLSSPTKVSLIVCMLLNKRHLYMWGGFFFFRFLHQCIEEVWVELNNLRLFFLEAEIFLYLIFCRKMLTGVKCLLKSPWKWGSWLWCEADRIWRGCDFLFYRYTPHSKALFLLACGTSPVLLPQLHKTQHCMCVCM